MVDLESRGSMIMDLNKREVLKAFELGGEVVEDNETPVSSPQEIAFNSLSDTAKILVNAGYKPEYLGTDIFKANGNEGFKILDNSFKNNLADTNVLYTYSTATIVIMSEEERLQLENELLLTCSKAQAINKYIDELEESSKLSELWCNLQQENKQLKQQLAEKDKEIEEQQKAYHLKFLKNMDECSAKLLKCSMLLSN